MALTHQARILCCRSRCALTLLELLVVIGIIALLFALLLPAIQASRESGRRIHCQNNMKQIGLAIGQHTASFDRLPPGWIDVAAGDPGWGWASVILPYLEEAASDPALSPLTGDSGDTGDPPGKGKGKGKAKGKTKGKAKKAKPIRHADMKVVREHVIDSYLCPSDPAPTLFMLHEDGSIEQAVSAAANSWGAANSPANQGNGAAKPSGGKRAKALAGPKKDKDKDKQKDKDKDKQKDKDKDAGAGPLGQGPEMFELARANYAGMYGTVSIDSEEDPNGVFFGNSDLPLSAIPDGQSTTIYVGER
jgi:type II secretory pathway pseudopilin PulG